jgi:hypothetical protein
MDPQAPLILADGGDVMAFASVEDLACYVESADVADGVYRAFDAAGRALRLATDGERVTVDALRGPVEAGSLAEVLSGAPGRGLPPGSPAADLPTLVEEFVARYGFTR